MSEVQNQDINQNEITEVKKQKENQKFIDFLKTPDAKEIIQSYQEQLYSKNSETTKYLSENIKHTIDNISMNLNISYSKTKKERGNIKVDEWKGFKGNVSNIKEYNTSEYIDTLRDLSLPQNFNNTKYVDFRSDIYGQYKKGEITREELKSLTKEPFKLYLKGEYGATEDYLNKKEEYFDAREQIDKHLKRNLSNTEEAFLDSIKNQRTQKDINEYKEGGNILGFELSEEEKKVISPLDILKKEYENASEDDKIELAKVMSRYMNDYGYDFNATNGRVNDVKSEDMWASYKEGGVAGVCRHHHSEVAKFLKSVGFESGIITINTGTKHAITWGKKDDGTFFMIDYGDYYEGKDPKELKAKYLAGKGASDLKEWIADADGNSIGTIQTDLEKLFEKTTSSIGTGDSLNHSKGVAKNNINIVKGHDLNINTDSEKSIGIDYKYGNGNIEGGIFYHKNKNLDYANYTSYGVSLAGKIGNKNNTFGELGIGTKLSKNTFEWQNGKERQYNVLGLDLQYSNELFNNNKTKIGLGLSAQDQTMQDIKNAREDGDNGIEDVTTNFGISLDLEHKFNSKLKANLNLGHGGDVGVENIRTGNGKDGFKIFEKNSVDIGMDYTKDDGDVIKVNGYYEKGLGYEKKGGDVSLQSGNITLEGGFEETDNSENLFLLDEAKKSIGLKYNILDTLNVNLGYEDTNNGSSRDKKINFGLNYKF